MKMKNGVKFFQCILNPDYLTNLIFSLIFKRKRFDWYKREGNTIVHLHSGVKEEICINDIVSWTIFPEMLFDKVVIYFADGSAHSYLDYNNDLIGILNEKVENKYKKQ